MSNAFPATPSLFNRRRLLGATAATGALAGLSGCKTLVGLARQVLKDPEVQVTNMEVRSATLQELNTVFFANVKNPNGIALSMKGLDYSLDVEGRRFADGSMEQSLKLPANGTAALQFPLRFPLGDTMAVVKQTLQKQTVDYVLGSVFHFGGPDFSVAVPVDFPGTAPVPQPPLVGVRSLQVVGIGPAGVGLRLKTWVQNRSAFDVPVDKLAIDLTLNNRKTLSATPVKRVQLAANKTRDVDVDFSVDFASLGLSLVDLARRPVVDWKVGLDLESGPLKFPFEQKGSLRLQP